MRAGTAGGGLHGGVRRIRWVSFVFSFLVFSSLFSFSKTELSLFPLSLARAPFKKLAHLTNSYDTVRYVYGSKLPFSSAPPDAEKLPDMHLARYDDVVAFDGASKLAYCVSWAHLDEHSSLEDAYADARSRLDALSARLAAAGRTGGPRLPASRIAMETSERPARPDATSNMTRDEFLSAVATTKEHILAGDVFQLVLSQRFERRTFADPFEVYRALRVVNPSPYMIYLQCRGAILVASSPEILCRVGADRKVTNRPLAGTRARGADAAADKALETELLADAKERAEHVMLVDLGRNDVGRVASPGTVEVEKLMVRRFGFPFFDIVKKRGKKTHPFPFPLSLSSKSSVQPTGNRALLPRHAHLLDRDRNAPARADPVGRPPSGSARRNRLGRSEGPRDADYRRARGRQARTLRWRDWARELHGVVGHGPGAEDDGE